MFGTNALFDNEGYTKKPRKHELVTVLEEKLTIEDKVFVEHSELNTALIVDFMSVARCLPLEKKHISISTLPSHIYSTILLYAKVTCNTHTPTKTRNCCPSLLSSFPR